VKIEQAFYGATKGGHSLVSASGDGMVASELTSRLDLPDTAPYGVEWSPYLSGFPHGNHYVLARTLLDQQASRAGMVFSHALIFPIEEMVRVRNLRDLAQLIVGTPTAAAALSTIDVEVTAQPEFRADEEQIAISTMLVSAVKRPLIRLSHIGFDEVIFKLWANLWPAIRRNFAFRLSFGPGDLVDAPLPTIVCTPPNLAARWVGYQTVISDRGTSELSPAAALLAGEPNGHKVLDIAENFGIEINSFGQLILVDRAYEIQSSATIGLNESIAMLRLVEALSGGKSSPAPGRETLVNRIIENLSNASVSQIRSLRNLALSSVDRPYRIFEGVQKWMAGHKFPSLHDVEMAELIRDAGESGRATPDWQVAIGSGLRSAKTTSASKFAEAFWRWIIAASPEALPHLLQGVDLVTNDEPSLVVNAPDYLDSGIAKTLLAISSNRGLYHLHAAVASLEYMPLKAVQEQIKLEPASHDAEGLRIALRKATPKQIVLCALSVHDRRVLELGANAASSHLEVLSDVDMSEQAAQDLWEAALRKNKSCWKGPNNPESTLWMILDMALDEKKMNLSLLVELAETPLANLNGYCRRAELWNLLSGTTKQHYIRATADGWLEAVEKNVSSPVETDVQNYILNRSTFPGILGSFLSRSVSSALKLISLLTRLDEAGFLSIFPLITANRLLLQDAEHLGRLIDERRWSRAADALVKLLRQRREDVRPALRACHGLLGFWTKFKLGVVPPSAEEKWQALASLCADLYPSGPDHNDLWRRAGGNNADLIYNGDGRSRWSDALFKVRRGYGLRAWTLLAKMNEEFGWNEDLRHLSQDSEFVERH